MDTPSEKERWNLERLIVNRITAEDGETISIERLQAVLGHVSKRYLPLAEGDALAIPTPPGELIELSLMDGFDGIKATTRIVDNGVPMEIAWRGGVGKTWNEQCREPERVPARLAPAFTPNYGSPPRRFESGGETLEVRWEGRPGDNLNHIWSMSRGNETILFRMWCEVVGLWATDKYILAAVMDTGLPRTTERPSELLTIQRGTGDPTPRKRDTPDSDRWHFSRQWQVKSFGQAPDVRIVAVKMTQKPEDGRKSDLDKHGVTIFSDVGHVFYRLRGDFATLQFAMGALWTWRPAPGGVTLTRYDLPRE